METVPKNKEDMNRLKERIAFWDFYKGNLVSGDSKATSIAVEYKSGLSSGESSRVVDLVRSTIEKAEFNFLYIEFFS